MASLRLAVNAALRGTGVPLPLVVVSETGAAAGRFDSSAWAIEFPASAPSTGHVVRAHVHDRVLAGVVVHEARHVEQWFRMAQLLAAQGRSAEQISDQLSIPSGVAALAARRSAGSARRHRIAAQVWLDSVYGSGAAHRNRVLADVLAARFAFQSAVDAYRTAASPITASALIEARKGMRAAFSAYEALPEEADALRAQEAHTRAAHDWCS